MQLGCHLSSKSIVKSGVSLVPVLGPMMCVMLITDLAGQPTCNYLFFIDKVKLIAPRSQQQELRSSLLQAHSWACRWDFPLDFHFALSEEDKGQLIPR